MAKVEALTSAGDGRQTGYLIECPACGFGHFFNVEQPGSRGQKWSFNGDFDKPTFSPSMLIRTGHYATGKSEQDCWLCQRQRQHKDGHTPCVRCHSYVRDGRIQFLGDCTHSMAGQTVDLPEVD